jgi:hypothetical protein
VAPDGCYQKQDTYTCLTGRSDSSECDGYASNPNCTLQSTSSCDPDDLINGNCVFEQRRYFYALTFRSTCRTSIPIAKVIWYRLACSRALWTNCCIGLAWTPLSIS